MRKIPTIFLRDEQDRRYVTDVIDPQCAWVFTDRGVKGTRKYDGTCTMLDDAGNWGARREIKPGKEIPPYFVESELDETTGKTVGWEPIGYSSFSRWHAEALREADETVEDSAGWKPGTYELIGPKVNGNPECYEHHWLIRHADAEVCMDGTISVDGVRDRVRELHARDGQEGIVFVHPDGRMAKLKARDLPKE